MSFVTPALLGGVLFVGVPIVLHLVMRRKPQEVVFPALRFVQSRRMANQTRTRLRHLLLLALRCAIIGLLALALSRPTIRGSGMLGGQNVPIAAALVFDDSRRMEYLHQNRTRLDQAKELGAWLLDQLPVDTPIAVLTRGARYRGFAADRGAAGLKVSRLATTAGTRPLEDAIDDAVELLEEIKGREKQDYRGEIYVFTDRSAASWSDSMLENVRKQLERLPQATLYLVDVGVDNPKNLQLGELDLPGEVLVADSPLTVETDLLATVDDEESETSYIVELLMNNGDGGAPQKRGKQVVEAEPGEPVRVKFSLAGLEIGSHQGEVRIATDDPLEVDNRRYFTVEVRPPRQVLLVAGQPRGAVFLREALAPTGAPGATEAGFRCQVTRPERLAGMALDPFDAVFMLDPGELSSIAWDGLADYVRQGGGLGIFLGRQASRGALPESAAALLAGPLRWQSREETYLRPLKFEHPVLAPLSDYREAIPWSSYPVFKYWEFSELAEDARVIASYANGRPAMVERSLGRGNVITVTTPVSDAAHREPWNLLPTGPDPWPFLALSNSLADYLAGARDDRLNYLAGQTAHLRGDLPDDQTNYVLRLPDGQSVRQSLVPARDEVIVTTTEMPGNYRIEAGGERRRIDRGFSVNVPPEISRLDQVPAATIQQALGEDRVKLARTTDQIEVQVGIGRVGRELFPWLIIALVLVLGGEQILANRFYRREA